MIRAAKHVVRKLITKVLSWITAFPVPETNRSWILVWMRKLRPFESGHPLIRLGPNSDGGYLIPDDLEGITACFSPGVSAVSGFEADCAQRGIKVFLADYSVDGPAEQHPAFTFTKKYLGATTSDVFMTLDSWVSENAPDAGDLLLQMDIEGCEYQVILSTSDDIMRRFRIIVVEFHFLDQMWNRPFYFVASPVFDKLLQTHVCVHIHPNNTAAPIPKRGLSIPPLMEFTFLRRDRVESREPCMTFPHPLDADCGAGPTVDLPRCWYQPPG